MSEHKNYINSEWIGSVEVNHNINPSNIDDIVGDYSRADAKCTLEAIAAAGAAFKSWKTATSQVRSDILDRIGTEILVRRDELGNLLSREEGKTLPEGIGEVTRAGMVFKFFAGEALRLGGDWIPSVRPGVDVEVMREPLGVIGIISPWNFPIAIPAWKIAPALAFGNCVVFKPAEMAPGSSWALTDIISRSGLPAGVFNLVMGPGSQVGDAIINSPGIHAISFTGSVEIGRGIASKAISRGVKLQLEMGGKNPLIVLDDADLPIAVNCAIQGAFYSTGQRCTASSRLIVTDRIHDTFVQAILEKMKSLKVDDALKAGTDIGPVVNQAQLDQNLEYLKIGHDEGANLAWGGELLARERKGYYLSPALFTETGNAMRINREEIFGPIATVIRVKGYEEALEAANDTQFGLSSGIVTTSLKYSSDFKKRSEVGMVMVNLPTAGVDYHVPFGGRKASSYDPRGKGSYARESFTVVETAYPAP